MKRESKMREENRELLVVKDKDIIQRARMNPKMALSNIQSKLIDYCFGLIKENYAQYEKNGMQYFEIKDFCKAAGINLRDNKSMVHYIKDNAEGILRKGIMIPVPEEDAWVSLKWVSDIVIKNSKTIGITIDKNMLEHVINQDNNFIAYHLIFTFPMELKYSSRLYGLFRSELYRGQRSEWEVSYTVDDLRELLGAGDEKSAYGRNVSVFRDKVVIPAVNEINEYTDIEAKWEPVKTRQKITAFKFILKNRSDEDVWEKRERNGRLLDQRAGVVES